MNWKDFLIRSTVWLSIVAYTIGCVVFATARGRAEIDRWVRLAWTVGCAALLAHYICAFQFFHAWSHASAYSDTARQTAEVFGINWGGGVFVNYAVAILWISDIAWWWFAGLSSYRRRPWLLVLAWHGFLIFIIFNATVVFVDGVARWIGVVVSLVLCLSWIVIALPQKSGTILGSGQYRER
ncbi:MAG TPA: hypothetical protein VJR02_01360 [Pyrinomonadaceae bacterium]|nr:hypothetical protein [Pyrinomonadaceae bacterium]